MASSQLSGKHKSRELRRRVAVPARLRYGSSWTDTCILNVSSRGLLIYASRPILPGTEVEIRKGEYAIVARVVWRDCGRAGLQCDERIPMEEIVTLGRTSGLQLTAVAGERRRRTRSDDRSRHIGRAIEFAGLVAVAASLAGGALLMVQNGFARPLATVSAALEN